MTPRVRGTLAVIGSACAFGSISPLTVVATNAGLALPALQTWRYATTAILLLAVLAWRRANGMIRTEPKRFGSVRPWYHPAILLLAGGGQALVATLALSALRWLPAATSAFLFYTYPAWVTILAAMRGAEALDRSRVIALVLALSGVGAMVGAPQAGSLHPVGVVVILAGALAYALYIPVLARLQEARSPVEVTCAIAVGGTIIFSTWALAAGSLQLGSLIGIGAGILQGLLSTGAFLGFLAGLAELGTVRTAITSTVEPFWTMLLGVIMLGQPLGVGTLVGGAAIMTAVLLLQRHPQSVPSTTPVD